MEGCLFFWVVIFAGLWINVIRWLIRLHEVKQGKRFLSVLKLVAIAAPPSLICGVVAYVLSQTAPFVQGNLDEEQRQKLWNFWVKWYMAFFFGSGLLTVLYLFWCLASFLRKDWRIKSFTLLFALATSLLTTMILSISAPAA
jgi:hypothetical protein